ncbi:AzlC family ABC transporter permease [Halobacterium litoreum]|uniref:AzlC family ABC transporter permease n=1 Tax=Halobacterium litoreum TaxID=2039234 RepID=A0ABD5NIN5_9EURY|nr:AzlC family ABC transporter permease [Halobacterium litoreum]UHH12301.1 AzlC family ABC transporter permease [Halobacterium litoreum]
MSDRADFVSGVWAAVPTLPANIPFGFVAGAAAVQAGFTDIQAVAMSGLIFGGASQLAAIELFNEGAPLAVVALTAVVVNLRYVMYSAAIAPYFREFTEKWRLFCSQFIVDTTFAIAVTEYERDESTDRMAFYLGEVAAIYVAYVGGTAAGVVFGDRMPDGLQLDFAVPLLFLALLVPSITDEATSVAAAVGGFAAVVGAGLPMNLGIVVAALCGIVAAALVDFTEVAA